VIPYQKRTSSIDWNYFDIGGTGAEDVNVEGKIRWSRVVEETQVSNKLILTGLVTTAGAVSAGALYRGSFKMLLRN